MFTSIPMVEKAPWMIRNSPGMWQTTLMRISSQEKVILSPDGIPKLTEAGKLIQTKSL